MIPPKQINGVWVTQHKHRHGANNAKERKTKASPTNAMPACVHRSEAFQLVGCQTCRGNVQVKVYQCDHFGVTCSFGGRAAEKNCAGCPEAKQ